MAAATQGWDPDTDVDTIVYDKTHKKIERKIGSCLLINNYMFFESEEFMSSEGKRYTVRSIPDYCYEDSDDEDDFDYDLDYDGYSTDEDEIQERSVMQGMSLLNSQGLTPKLGDALFKVGFNIRGRPNRTISGMKECLKKFATSKGRYYDKAVVIIIMSHGGNGCVLGSDDDGDTINLNKVFSYFTDKACPALKGKPKVFLIDACRQEIAAGACEIGWKKKLGADMTLMYSTSFETSALDGPQGSFFARSLMSALQKVANSEVSATGVKFINVIRWVADVTKKATKKETGQEQVPVIYGDEPTFLIKRRVP